MKKCKKLVQLIVPARTVRRTVLEKNFLTHTQEKNQNSSTAELLTFSSWFYIICPNYHMIISDALVIFLRMFEHASHAC